MENTILESMIGAMGAILGGLIVYFANRKINGANIMMINADTILKLGQRVKELETRDDEKSKQIDELEMRDDEKSKQISKLESELTKFRKAYSRALTWIHTVTPPTVTVPDFFKDTGDLNSGIK